MATGEIDWWTWFGFPQLEARMRFHGSEMMVRIGIRDQESGNPGVVPEPHVQALSSLKISFGLINNIAKLIELSYILLSVFILFN